MQEPSSVDLDAEPLPGADVEPADFRWPKRVLLLLLNYIPLLHAGSVLWLLASPARPLGARIGWALALLYLFPPLAGRVVRALIKMPEGRIALGTRAFFGWWTLLQLQAVFCRLTFLEEAMRLVPSLYSNWLRLWGARIGRLTFWSAGTVILDRSFLEIGDDVVFGAGVRLNAHVLARNAHGDLELLLGTIRIGDRATVGGYSLLTAGTEIAAGEMTRAYLISPPFSRWQGGRRIRNDKQGATG